MSKTIVSAATSDIYTDQRVLKTAYTLHNQGYNITVLGRLRHNSKPVTEPFCVKRFKLWFNTGFMFYACFNLRLFIYLLFSKYDIILSNDTDTLLSCYLASKIRQKKLVFDAHELFPEIPELYHRPIIKKFWTIAENLLFPQLSYCYTVSQSIADYYKNKYNVPMQVVRNIPALNVTNQKEEKILNFGNQKIILYQGAVNTGRGIEWILKAMPMIQNAVFVIIGDGDILKELKQLTYELKISEKVIFIGAIPGDELQKYTTSADLGVCLLENRGLSYYYSLPNRIFAFIHAEVPILATDFPEIRRIVGEKQTGVLINDNAPDVIARKINEIFAKPFPVEHFSALKKELCWENEEKIIIEIFKTL